MSQPQKSLGHDERTGGTKAGSSRVETIDATAWDDRWCVDVGANGGWNSGAKRIPSFALSSREAESRVRRTKEFLGIAAKYEAKPDVQLVACPSPGSQSFTFTVQSKYNSHDKLGFVDVDANQGTVSWGFVAP